MFTAHGIQWWESEGGRKTWNLLCCFNENSLPYNFKCLLSLLFWKELCKRLGEKIIIVDQKTATLKKMFMGICKKTVWGEIKGWGDVIKMKDLLFADIVPCLSVLSWKTKLPGSDFPAWICGPTVQPCGDHLRTHNKWPISQIHL